MVRSGGALGQPAVRGSKNVGDGVPASLSVEPVAVLTKMPNMTCDATPFPLTTQLSVIRSHFPGQGAIDMTWGLVMPKKSTSSVMYVEPPDCISKAVPLLSAAVCYQLCNSGLKLPGHYLQESSQLVII